MYGDTVDFDAVILAGGRARRLAGTDTLVGQAVVEAGEDPAGARWAAAIAAVDAALKPLEVVGK